MEINFTLFYIIIGILVAFFILLVYIINNLLKKVEKYEDVVQDQVQYLQNIANSIAAGQKHLNDLDSKGVFESDDEVGYFFSQMKAIQEELNRYMLPENYGKEEIQS